MVNWGRAGGRGWGRYRRLFGADGFALVEALARLIVVDARLRRGGFRHVIERAQRQAAPSPIVSHTGDVVRARRYAGLLRSAARAPFPRARCLHQSLALYLWLRDEGVASELRIGVRKDGGALRAHAWVEVGGQVVNDRPASIGAFTPLFSTGPDSALPHSATRNYTWSPAWS
jgi:hypothetical protein